MFATFFTAILFFRRNILRSGINLSQLGSWQQSDMVDTSNILKFKGRLNFKIRCINLNLLLLLSLTGG